MNQRDVTMKIIYYIIDAFARRELDYILHKRPKGGFAQLIKHGGVKTLNSIFPAETMPAQASLITGEPPAKHGLSANLFCYEGLLISMDVSLGPIPKLNFYHYFDLINNFALSRDVKTIFEYAKEHDLKTYDIQEFIFRGANKIFPPLYRWKRFWFLDYLYRLNTFYVHSILKGKEYTHMHHANFFLKAVNAIKNGFDFVVVYNLWTDFLVHHYGEKGIRDGLIAADIAIERGLKKLDIENTLVVVTADHGFSFAKENTNLLEIFNKHGIKCMHTNFSGYTKKRSNTCYVTTGIGHFAQIFLNGEDIDKVLQVINNHVPYEVLMVKEHHKMKVIEGDIDRELIDLWVGQNNIKRVGDIAIVSPKNIMYGQKSGYYHSSHYPEDREVPFITSNEEVLHKINDGDLITEAPQVIIDSFSVKS